MSNKCCFLLLPMTAIPTIKTPARSSIFPFNYFWVFHCISVNRMHKIICLIFLNVTDDFNMSSTILLRTRSTINWQTNKSYFKTNYYRWVVGNVKQFLEKPVHFFKHEEIIHTSTWREQRVKFRRISCRHPVLHLQCSVNALFLKLCWKLLLW